GIDAANGAIIITTKKGKKGSMKIDYVANFMLEKITRFPNVQDKYGLGSKGVTSQTGLQYWGAETPAGATKFDNLDKFYGYGLTNNQSVSISGGSDNVTYLASANIFRQNGSMPGTGYDKNTFRLNLGAKLSEKLNFSASVSYLNTETRRPPATKGLGSSFYYATIWPRTDDMSNWENSPFKGTVDVPVTGSSDDLDPFDNPYFSVNKNKIKDVTDRLMLNGSLSYDPTSWLNLTARVGLDRYQTNGSSLYDAGSYYRYPNRSIAFNVKGVFAEYTSQNQIINAFFLATFKKKVGDWNSNLTLGYNIDSRENRVDSRYGEGFLVPDLPSISNTNRNSRDQATRGTRRNLFGVFGELKIDYKNYLFFNFTGRNDWSSTLPKANNNFFYPSASVSFVASEALNLDKSGTLSFLKLRVAVAQVGKDAPPHQILPALQEFTRTGGGYNLGFFGPNDNIKPETTTSYEAGLDLRFFNNRLALDVTYYRVRSKNQIVQPRLSYASGYILQLVNSGEIENQGIEALLTAKAYMGEKFSWDVIANFTLNRNKVIALPGDFTEFYLSDSWLAGAARGGYIAGSPYSSITGNSFKRDANGQMLIGDNGYPIRDTRYLEIGNRQPNFTLGITNVFRYKDFMLSALLDIRSGGDVFNGTDWALTALGLSQRTLDRGKAMTFEGIVEKTGEKNTKEVILDQDYYTGVSGAGRIEESFIEKSVNWLRLRDISLSYTLPKALLEKTKIVKNLSINFTGNNLWLWTNYSGADPDVNGLNAAARGSGAVGFDYFSVASPKTYSLGLKATF
ncbi:MAG: SusC/RagA family TonB-linked outer membrane protein, partial [Bacteroidetes bacterium]